MVELSENPLSELVFHKGKSNSQYCLYGNTETTDRESLTYKWSTARPTCNLWPICFDEILGIVDSAEPGASDLIRI